MTEIAMPQLSDSMERGLVLQWLIEDGSEVRVGDELVEIETDKATMTYTSEVAGTLSIIIAEGATVPVGEPIARVGAAEPAAGNEVDDPTPGGDPAAEPTAEAEPARAPVGAAAVPAPAEPGARNGNWSTRASPTSATPVARRLAAIHGIELGSLQGSGPRGRIIKADVLAAGGIEASSTPVPARRSSPTTPPPAAAPVRMGNGTGQIKELSRLQKVVARRMAEAKSTIPHFQVQTEVAIDAALSLRAQLKEAAAALGESAPSVNDLIVKACGLALRRHSQANGSYRDGRFELHDRVNVGVAVAAEGALVVPTVFDADTKSLATIAAETTMLADRVRSGQITPPELSGATFTVSNLGMFGMTAITPVINPPQAAILGVGAARPVLARDNTGEIVDRSLLTLTLSCDHRILYGADAARFLADIKATLEAPLRLAFG